jgi:hypothetical protein
LIAFKLWIPLLVDILAGGPLALYQIRAIEKIYLVYQQAKQALVLAKSLYFQFADEAISLYKSSAVHQICGTKYFGRTSSAKFGAWKPFSIPIDLGFPKTCQISIYWVRPSSFAMSLYHQMKALCIGTLMSQDLPTILSVETKEDRVQKVWELQAVKNGGLPASIIFFEEARLTAPGWRSAPMSLE